MNIRFGLIGVGNIGIRQAKLIQQHPNADLISVFDTSPTQMEKIRSELNVKISISEDQFFSDSNIDVVSICTPNNTHCPLTIKALKAGKHVLVEKPMALKMEDCELMLNTALMLKKQLFVVKQNRYNPPIIALKNALNLNKLGKIYFVAINCFWNRGESYYKESKWKGKLELDGGTLFTQFSHFVDIMYFLFGDIRDIAGLVKNVNHHGLIEFEDTGSFSFSFKSGALGSFNYTTSAYKKNMEGSITVFCENGTVKVGGQYLNKLDYLQGKDLDFGALEHGGAPNDYGSYVGSMSNHDKVINNVILSLQGIAETDVTAMDGMKTVEIIEKMYRRAKKSSSIS